MLAHGLRSDKLWPMRIIAGTHRGRRILGPEDDQTTRPIPDRVKQSLFDRLAARDLIEGAVVLDIFSGTGSMGLECLSRDAAHATFVEKSRRAVMALKQNLETLKLTEHSRVISVDALGGGLADALSDRNYSLLFIDPPYRLLQEPEDAPSVYQQIARLAKIAALGAVLMLRAERRVKPPPIEGWTTDEPVTIGTMTLHFFHH